ncbi:MAG: RNA polymerase sigma-70 factor [Cyclonatronaceae bacterium]
MEPELYDLRPEQANLLFQLIAESDEKAFNRLFRAGFSPLVLFACRYVGDKNVAADMVQETFIKLWEKRETLQEVYAARSYLYRAVRNLCLNYVRDHAREQPMETYEATGFEQFSHSPATAASDDQEDIQRSRRQMQLLQQWISQLPARQQEAFELSRFEGLDHDEIAEVMNVSAKTVNNHITGALQSIRRLRASHEKKNMSLNKWPQVSGI